jgi:UDP-GlcNAc:undecaprenyl-phosphate GlcNAc-1-phosphate transferase
MQWPSLLPNSLIPLLAFLAAGLIAAGLTRLHVWLGRRLRHFATPDTFHREPVALSGGVGIWVAFLLVTLVAEWPAGVNWLILGPSLAMVAIGLCDDVRPLTPQRKLLLQVAVSTVSVGLGLRFEMPGLEMLSIPLSILWLVSMANAFNLIDNMDGLAAGVAAISAILLGVYALAHGSWEIAVAAAAFAGAHAGFLPFNFKPARIFMGDCGSMGAGFFLSAVSIAGDWRNVSNLLFVVVPPVLVLAVPIFNLLFIIITRKLSGVPLSHGRADHINYRLVAHGLSERKSVLFIYALSAGCGMLALWYSQLGSLALVVSVSLVTVVFLYLGIFLFEESVAGFYNDFSVEQHHPVDLTKLPFAQYWWRVFQVLVDLILISGGYFIAYLIRFEGSLPPAQERNFIVTLPYIILIKTAVFSQLRLYGSHWRYVGVNDLLKIVYATGLSVLAVAAGVMVFQPAFFSRSVLIIDAILTVLLIGASRVLLRVFREFIIETRSMDGLVRTLIIGAGDSGELMLRMARRNGQLALNIVGFVDDDPRKAKAIIHGVPILGPTSALPAICRDRRAELAIVAMPSPSGARIGEIAGLCQEAGVKCKVLSLRLDDSPDAGAE